MEPSRFKAFIRFNKRRTQTLYKRVQRQLFYRSIVTGKQIGRAHV